MTKNIINRMFDNGDAQIAKYCQQTFDKVKEFGEHQFIVDIGTMPPNPLVFTELDGKDGKRGSVKVKKNGNKWRIQYKGTTRRCLEKDAMKGIYCAIAGEVLSKHHRRWDSERISF